MIPELERQGVGSQMGLLVQVRLAIFSHITIDQCGWHNEKIIGLPIKISGLREVTVQEGLDSNRVFRCEAGIAMVGPPDNE